METSPISTVQSGDSINPEHEKSVEKSLIMSPEAKSFLLTTARWSGFIAIVGFAMIGIMVIVSVAAFFISPLIGEFQDFQMFQYMPMPFYFLGLLYLIMAAIYFFPYYFLYVFSKKVKAGLMKNDQVSMDEGLKNLKRLAKFVGIVTIISLALMLLIIPMIIFSVGMMQALM